MEYQVNLFFVSFLFHLCTVCLASDPVVVLSTGKVRGQRLVSAANRSYFSFRGIPYAEPPVGYFRFKGPQPLKSWNGTLEAFHIPPACSQPWRYLGFPESYSEDCLYLNVFTPHLKHQHDLLMPVMVWIHGGKEYQGSGTPYKYGADFLITENVILVTFNYRLGVFGYLNSNSESAQGNAAAKDKVAVLRWVQREIKQFGGDPKSVTIFGGSSGGQDVNCLYISPMAQGLFQRAISESSASCGVTIPDGITSGINPGLRLAEELGCPSSDPEEVVDCMRNITAQVLAEKQQDVFISELGQTFNPFLLSVEEDHGEEIFMDKPAEQLRRICKSKVPYMMGFNSGEGKMFVQVPEDNPTLLSDFEKNMKSYLPKYMHRSVNNAAREEIVEEIKQFYFGYNTISFENVNEYMNFMTDRHFAYFAIANAKTFSSQAPVYLYYFAFEGAFKNRHSNTDQLNFTGVNHADELGYLFYRNLLIPEQNHMTDYPRECMMLAQMVRLWTNFAKYGNPTPDENDGVLAATWLPVNGSRTRHLLINDSLHMVTQDLLPERMAIWEGVFRLQQYDEAYDRTVGFVIIKIMFLLGFIALIFLIFNSSCLNRLRHDRIVTYDKF